jgi:hypothetical protein
MHFYIHFIGKETDSYRLSDFPQIIQPVYLKELDPRFHDVKPWGLHSSKYTMYLRRNMHIFSGTYMLTRPE